jgi:hypothetical protein
MTILDEIVPHMQELLTDQFNDTNRSSFDPQSKSKFKFQPIQRQNQCSKWF